MDIERELQRLAALDDPPRGEAVSPGDAAPARLKSRIYSALVQHLAESGPLRPLSATEADGHRLCVFEELLTKLPVPSAVETTNPCRVCHARVMGERLKRAPIFWPGCPYSDFHRS